MQAGVLLQPVEPHLLRILELFPACDQPALRLKHTFTRGQVKERWPGAARHRSGGKVEGKVGGMGDRDTRREEAGCNLTDGQGAWMLQGGGFARLFAFSHLVAEHARLELRHSLRVLELCSIFPGVEGAVHFLGGVSCHHQTPHGHGEPRTASRPLQHVASAHISFSPKAGRDVAKS